MSDKMESTGKTVDEAVREALLRMGLRRDEVSVTVIQEARGGFFGVGRRQAVVEVAKRSASRRDSGRGRGRDRDDEGRGGRRSRGGRRGETSERQTAGSAERSGSRRSRGGRGSDASRGDKPARDSQSAPRAASGRGGRDDSGKSAPRDGRQQADGRQKDGDRDAEASSSSSSSRRRRRPRRRRKSGATADAQTPAVTNGSTAPVVDKTPDSQPETRPMQAAVTERPSAAAEKPAEKVDTPARDETPRVAEAPRQEREKPASATIATDLVAANRVAPFGAEDAGNTVDLLDRATTSLMVKSGFQSRVTVRDDEYHQVKVVVDDRSAGVLIGRQGSTVDAIEHLVERIATRTVGERVKLNLDVNNYRLRREDGLLGVAHNAIAEARNTGQPVAMDPAGGRERRIVHLEVEVEDDLVTFTDDGQNGKRVVICRPEQVPAEYRNVELHGPAPQQAEASASAGEAVNDSSAEEIPQNES